MPELANQPPSQEAKPIAVSGNPFGAPMSRKVSLLSTLILTNVWIAGLYGTLYSERWLAGRFGDHSICGWWGCGPPTETLVVWHGFCLLAIVAPAAYIGTVFPAGWLRVLGWTLIGASLSTLVAMAAYEYWSWQSGRFAVDLAPLTFLRRYMFVVTTAVNLPVVPVFCSGLMLLCIVPKQKRYRPFAEQQHDSK